MAATATLPATHVSNDPTDMNPCQYDYVVYQTGIRSRSGAVKAASQMVTDSTTVQCDDCNYFMFWPESFATQSTPSLREEARAAGYQLKMEQLAKKFPQGFAFHDVQVPPRTPQPLKECFMCGVENHHEYVVTLNVRK